MPYRLLDAFRSTFAGHAYLHRNSTLGDAIAAEFFEDLVDLGRSTTFARRVRDRLAVVNRANSARGIRARRGDGTLGEIVPAVEALDASGFQVARGSVATIEIGIEVKIVATAMIKQIDRVTGDLQKQVAQFARSGGQPISVGIVGINSVGQYTSYEGKRSYTTDGKTYRHPSQDAAEAESRLLRDARPSFDEFLVLRYRASNEPPFPFEWVDYRGIELDYGAVLARVSREYELRFGQRGA